MVWPGLISGPGIRSANGAVRLFPGVQLDSVCAAAGDQDTVDEGVGADIHRARLIGGCSSTNGAFWVRGWPADYDAWAAAGNTGWSFHDLLPVFCAVETDTDFSDDAARFREPPRGHDVDLWPQSWRRRTFSPTAPQPAAA